MIYDSAIRNALLTRLQTVVSEDIIAQENVQFTPSDGIPWVRETLLPGTPDRAEMMTDGRFRQIGVYQVDVFVPSGIGPDVADTIAESIAEAYTVGSGYTSEDVTVRIRRVYARPGRESGDLYQKPVVIDWWIME